MTFPTPHLTLMTPSNPKIIKGQAFGYGTAILHLAPGNLSGHEVCPKRSVGCTSACLNTAGQGGIVTGYGITTQQLVANGMRNTIQSARIRRTQYLFSDRAGFIATLIRDMERWSHWCGREGLGVAFRLNGTSDLDWHGLFRNAGHDLDSVLHRFEAKGYDYTKVPNRLKRVSSVYHLTLSLSESNDNVAHAWLRAGRNVAVVFNVRGKKGPWDNAEHMIETFPINGESFPVVDGDKSDLRFLDQQGVIVGLRAKGNARKDASGFVRDVGAHRVTNMDERIAV